MEPIRVLFLAANPSGQTRLKLDAEYKRVTNAIRASEHRDRFANPIHLPGVMPSELQSAFLQHRPHVIHFSGHGSPDNEIIFEDMQGGTRPVTGEALRSLFAVLRDQMRVVVLNACYSQSQAAAISEVIDCVVGMSAAITDTAALDFAESFYSALGYGRSVQEAFELGRVQIQLEGLGEEHTPQLDVRAGVDASALHLLEGPAVAPVRAEPAPPAAPKAVHVDREQEIAVFERMLAQEGDAHVFVIRAGSGMGKTALLAELWRRAHDHARARVSFKRLAYRPAELLDELAEQVGLDRLPGYAAVRDGSPPSRAVDAKSLEALGSTPVAIGRRLGGMEPGEALLTDAFLTAVTDLTADGLVVLFFDSFDRDGDEIARWFQVHFLARVVNIERLIAVVAGQAQPSIAWDDAFVERTLRGFGMEQVREWALRLELDLAPEVIESLYITSNEGNPLLLRNYLESHLYAQARRNG